MRTVPHYISGKTVEGQSGRFGDIYNPSTGEVQAQVQLATQDELSEAVAVALAAQQGWSATNPQRRARVMFKFKELLEANMDELAAILSSEHGKVIADSKGDIQRGLEVIEFACGIHICSKVNIPKVQALGLTSFPYVSPWCCRGHYPVQLPCHDPHVDVRCGDCMRQCFYPQTVRERPYRASQTGRTHDRSRTA